MRPSTMAKLALGVILVGLVAVGTAHEGLGFLLGVTIFVGGTLGFGTLIVLATGLYDK